ncbi:MAG: PAS domain S-box protein, partial [Pseudomonadota bacterium]|nr:PAS domain S-box protein [Pseudomonadota bacterium]
EVTTNPFIYQNKQVLMVSVRDTSERQKIETMLWESESKYRQLFEAASNPTVVFDANSQQFFDVNRAAIDLYGFSKEEWLRMTTESVSAEPVKKRAAFSSGSAKGQIIPLRWHKKKDGTVFPVEISAGNTYLFQGRSLICATVRDITERRASEEALRKERDFINTLVQASPAFFFAISPEGKIRMMNKAMLFSLEYTLEEVMNQDFLNYCIPKNEQALVSAEFENLTKSMQPSLLEYHVLSKSGKTLLVEWHSRAIIKANGALDYFFGVGIDVTERKKAQGHLRLFKSIVESSEESIAISNPEGQLVYLNPAYEKLFGLAVQEMKQKQFIAYYPPESVTLWEQEVLPALTRGGSWQGELDVFYKDGNLFPIWQRIDAVRDNRGNILFIFGLMHDISERKRMWETLRMQWEEHQMIFNAIPAMIWYRDKDNHLSRSNRLATKTFQQEDKQVNALTDCEDIIQLGRPQYGVIKTYQNTAQETRWIQIDKIPYHDIQGNLAGVIVFAIDITEYKQTQVHLQASEERMHLVVENMPIMLNAFDNEGHIIAWNQACQNITGYSAEEIIGNTHALEILYPETADRDRMLAHLDTRARPEDPLPENGEETWETHVTCKEGHLKTIAWFSVSKRFNIPGWHAWFLGQDITQRKHMEHLLEDNRALLASMIEMSKLGLCLTDDRGRFVQVNRAYAELYGYQAEELVGQPFTYVLPHSTHNEAVREYYSLLMTHEEP